MLFVGPESPKLVCKYPILQLANILKIALIATAHATESAIGLNTSFYLILGPLMYVEVYQSFPNWGILELWAI